MKYLPHILFLLLVAGVASAAPSVIYQRTILPETDSTYELGTSTRAWLRVNSDIFCLTGDSCITSWPSGGGSGTISTSSPLTTGLLVQSTGASTIANIATSSLGLLTTHVSEGSNLYFTNARARSAISLTTTGTSGAATYDSGTGVINIPNYATGGGTGTVATSTALTAGEVAVATGVNTIGSYAQFLYDSTLQKLTVTNASTTNLSIGSLTGVLKQSGGVVSGGATTSDVPEGSNLYYTDARVASYITGSSTLPAFLNYWTKSGSDLSYSAGNVGIGTTSPSQKLHVTGDAYFEDAAADISLKSNTAISAADTSIGGLIYRTSDDNARIQLRGLSEGTSDSSGLYFSIRNGGAERFTVRSSGNVGIGTTSPGATLGVQGTGLFSGLATFESGFNIGNSTLTSLLGNGLVNSAGSLSVSTTSLASGFFQQGGNSFGTTATLGTNDSQSLAFETNGSTRMTITTSGNVGIGTASPDGKLHVHTGSAGTVTADSNADDLTIENSGNTGLSLLSPDANNSRIAFGSPSDNLGAQISWNYTTALFTVGATAVGAETRLLYGNGSEGLRINASGNVGVGTTTPTRTLSVSGTLGSTPIVYIGSPGTSQTLSMGTWYGGATANSWIDANGALVLNPSGGGNVGIGTASPDYDFHVERAGSGSTIGTGNFDAAANLFVGSTYNGGVAYNTGNQVAAISAWSGEAGLSLLVNDVYGWLQAVDSSGNFQLRRGYAGQHGTALSVDTNGDVGIGGSTDYRLDVRGGDVRVSRTTSGTGDAALYFGGTAANNYIFGGDTSNVMTFGVNGSERMRINSSGNVGIGTTTPGTILSIGSSTQYINLSNTATSTFAFGIQAPSINLSGFLQAVSGVFTSILTIPYNAALSLVSNGDIGIDSTSNQFQYRSGGATRVLGNGNFYPAFTYSTSTAWTGTTTIPLGPAYVGETWNGVQCFTDTGTVNVSFYDGTNRMNMFNASTTVGTIGLVTNNTFTASEKRYVDIGTPASSPTKVSCTVSKSLTAQ